MYNNSVQTDPDSVLEKLSEKLNALKSIQYDHRRELNYLSQSLTNELSGKVFLDFSSVDKIIGAKYYFTGSGTILAFNGSESFICSDSDGSILINRAPKEEYMETLSFLNHSVFTLKRALPWIIADKTLKKTLSETVVDGKECYEVQFTLKRGVIGTVGKKWTLTEDRDLTYKIFIAKKDYLPVGIWQANNRNTDFLKTSFTNIRMNMVMENDSLFYYSTYLQKYKERDKANTIPLIRPGVMSFDWKLRNIDQDEVISLSALKGNVVMLDFWIYHCSSCIAQIPSLNGIREKYQSKNFRMFGVNAYDSPEMIQSFKEKRGPIKYDILFQGDSVRLKYGVDGFPTVILLDKKGTVLYAGELDKQKIEKLIEDHL